MKIKIDSESLQLGMYVSELDRPWIESPFIFQGFYLRSPEEIEQIQEICDYVYVDTDKPPIDINTGLQIINKNKAVNKAPKRRAKKYTETVKLQTSELEKSEFNEELVVAREARDNTRSYIDNVLEDARMGNSVDTQQAKSVVIDLAESITRNPDASVWLTNLKNRDEYTAIHSVNVCVLTLTFARALGFKKEHLIDIGMGAQLHDIGTLRVPLDILNKPGKLTDEEFKIMKGHPVLGYELLMKDKVLSKDALSVVLGHHERLGGTGYPEGKTDSSINHYTRIVSIVDVYDAITSDRVYHNGMTPHEALKKMYEWAPGNFDDKLMQAFIRTIGIYPVGSLVELKSGHIGLVVKLNEEKRLKPIIIMIMNRYKEYYPKRKLVNLASPMWEKKKDKPEIHRILDAKEYDIDVKNIIQEESISS